MDLSRRSYETEIMDDLSSQGAIITQTLRELEFINKWLGGNAVTLGALNKIRARLGNGSPVTIADLGCGGGDMLRIVNSWAVRNGIRVNLVGIDANPNIVEYARKNLSDLPNVTFLHADVFSAEFAQMRFDVVIGTLFFHHFTQQQLIQFFAQVRKQVRVALIINDIHRHFLAYYSIKILTKLFSKSPMVVHDAPLSVERAFSREELRSALVKSGFEEFVIAWKWAFRWQIVASSR